MSDGLAAFIRARLDEDEAAAKAVREPPDWHQGDESDPWARWDRDMIYMWPPEFTTPFEEDKHWRGLQANDEHLAGHIALHDPTRVLREVASRRARLALMIKAMEDMDAAVQDDAADPVERAVKIGFYKAAVVAVKHDAAVYGDHPDYQETWKP